MPLHLIVSEPFKGYQKGDRITDEAEVNAAIETHIGHVTKYVAADEPVAEEKKDPPAPPAARKTK